MSNTSVPVIPDVANRTPEEAIAFFRGTLPGFTGSGPNLVGNFSASDIFETMDTVVLDNVRAREGQAAVDRLNTVMARAIFRAIHDVYGQRFVVIALDAGHGGKQGYYWDPGSNGTEAVHTRELIAAVLQEARQPANRNVLIRPIYNDQIADSFGLPAADNQMVMDQVLMRQTRASMLTNEAATWNHDHASNLALQVAVQEISLHFNEGSNGALVLYQAHHVDQSYADRSLALAKAYLSDVIPALNTSRLLPGPLHPWAGTGLHDEVMMYRPTYLNSPTFANIIPRYGALQAGTYLPRYIQKILDHKASRSTSPTRTTA